MFCKRFVSILGPLPTCGSISSGRYFTFHNTGTGREGVKDSFGHTHLHDVGDDKVRAEKHKSCSSLHNIKQRKKTPLFQGSRIMSHTVKTVITKGISQSIEENIPQHASGQATCSNRRSVGHTGRSGFRS